jgi:hypothetical protein
MESIEESDSEVNSQPSHLQNMPTYLRDDHRTINNNEDSDEWTQLSGEDVVNLVCL